MFVIIKYKYMNYDNEYYHFLLKKVKDHFKSKNIKINKQKYIKPNLDKLLEFHDIYVQTCQSPNIKLRNTYFPSYLNLIKKRIYYTLKMQLKDFDNENKIVEIMNLIDYYTKNISKHNLETLIHHFHLIE